MPTSETTDVPPTRRPRRPGRRLLLGASLALLLLIATLALLPSLLGARTLEWLARGRFQGSVTATSAAFSWFGEQRLEGLKVGTLAGKQADRELLRIGSVTVQRSLLGLLRGGEKIAIEVKSPELFVHRHADGRFNFEGLLNRQADAGRREPRPSEPGDDRKEPSPQQRPLPNIPGLPVELAVVVTDGQIVYVDDLLETRGEARSVAASFTGGANDISLRLNATAGSGGTVAADAVASKLAAGSGPSTLDATVSLAAIDLHPYRGIIEDLWGVIPPPRPVNGNFRIALGAENAELTGSLDADFLRIDNAVVTFPVAAPATADGRFTFAVELAPALASLRGAVPALQSVQLSGSAHGSVQTIGFTSLVKLTAQIEAKDLVASLERNGQAHAVKEENLKLHLSLEPAENNATALVSDLRSPGLTARLEGTTLLAEAELPFDGLVAAELQVVKLTDLLGVKLPANIEVDPGARLRLRDFKLAGRARSTAPLETLQGAGRLEIDGPIKTTGIEGSNLTALLRAAQGVFTVADLKAAVNGGSATLPELVIDLTAPEPSFRGTLTVDGAACTYELASLLAYAVPFLALEDRQGALEGVIAATLEISGRGTGMPSLEKSLAGAGKLRIRQGKIQGSRFFAEASRVLGATLGDVLFAEIGSDFTIGAGKVESTKLFLVGREGSKLRNLGLSGHVGLDQSMDFGVDLGALEETIGDKKIRRVLKQANSILGDKLFPLKLRGTLSEPRLSLETSLESALKALPDLDSILDDVLKPPPDDAGKPEKGGLDDILDLFKKRKQRK